MKTVKYLFIVFIASTMLLAQSETTQRIKSNENTLVTKDKLEKDLSRQLEEIGKSLKQEENSLLRTNKQIEDLTKKIQEEQGRVDVARVELNSLSKQNAELMKARSEIEESLVKLIAKELSYSMVVNQGYQENQENVITDEVLEQVRKNMDNEFKKYQEEYTKTDIKINEHSNKIASIQNSIKDLESKKKELGDLTKSKTKIISDIEKERLSYHKKLESVQAEKSEIIRTLQSLKIIEKKEKETVAVLTPKGEITTTYEKIIQIGSSNKASKVKK
ncbi:MAG: hypothetical protein ACK5LP_10185 [Campylobacteraceae bacterium]